MTRSLHRPSWGWQQPPPKPPVVPSKACIGSSARSSSPSVPVTSRHTKLGEHERARAYALRALELQRASLGEQHPAVGTSLNNLGALEPKIGRPREALDLARQALAIWEKSEGPQSRRLPAGWDTEGSALLELSRPHEARDVWRRPSPWTTTTCTPRSCWSWREPSL